MISHYKSKQRTGRITDPLHNWNNLPREMKGWQKACLCCGVGIQLSGLVSVAVFFFWKFFGFGI